MRTLSAAPYVLLLLACGASDPPPAPLRAPEPCRPEVASPYAFAAGVEERVNLESAMRRGPVVVAVRCGEVKVVPNCRAEGGAYELVVHDAQEVVVRGADESELEAKIPGWGASAEARLRAGEKADLSVVTRGTLDAHLAAPIRVASLQGACEGASHVVARAEVGAYVVAGAGPGRRTYASSGELAACAGTGAPVAGCRNVVRVGLVPVVP